MDKALFSVSCTTCRARISVRKKDAIGQILECPKCSSMVLIEPPEGWVEEVVVSAAPVVTAAPPATPAAEPTRITAATRSTSKSGINGKKAPAAAPNLEANGKPTAKLAPGEAASEPAAGAAPIQIATAAAAPPIVNTTAVNTTAPVVTAPVVTVPVITRAAALPSLPPVIASQTAPPLPTEGPQAVAVKLGFTPYKVPEAVAGETFLSALGQSFWGRLAVLAISGLLGLTGMLAIFKMVTRQPAVATTNEKPKPETAQPEAAPIAKNSPEQINRRWLPEQTVFVLDMRPSLLKQGPIFEQVKYLDHRWGADVTWLLSAFNMPPEKVHRLTWAATDLRDVQKNCVAIIELEQGVDASQFLANGNEVNLGGNFAHARRMPSSGWEHPAAAVDAHTIVTGNETLLRGIAGRNQDAELAHNAMDMLVKKLVPAGEVTAMLDLGGAREAGWKLPSDRLDVWQAGKTSWRTLCEGPLAAGLSVQMAGGSRCELAFICPGATRSENLRMELESFITLVKAALPDHAAGLMKSMPASKFPAEATKQYGQALNDLASTLISSHCDSADGIIWLRLNWVGRPLPEWIDWMLGDGDAVRQADWLIAARAADEANHRGLLAGLLRYVGIQKPPVFPEAARNVGALHAETRLSWIADMLPYLGHADWNLQAAYNWNSKQNQPIVERQLPEVTNPAFGPTNDAAGYPVTNYVGAAGVGENAAYQAAGQPGTGVFGYGRQTRQQDLVRGGANTIAVLGAQGQQCGPWAQGGTATVRPLTRKPYINGPDGFGSGQADGMVVGMADGSARFISKNIDPHIMEQLVTVAEGGQVDMASIDPQAVVPENVQPAPAAMPKPQAPVTPKVATVKPEPSLDPKLRVLLGEPVRKISLPQKPLAEAAKFVASIGALNVSFDPDAMEELGVTLRDPVSLDETDGNVDVLLRKIAAQRNMAMSFANGQLLFTSPREYREQLRPQRYKVEDLTHGDAQAAADLAALIERFVAPESWQSAGGPGSIEVVSPDVLQVTATGKAHYYAIDFVEKLRLARGMAPKLHHDPQKFNLETHIDRARAILGHVTSVNVYTPTPLAEILEQLKQPAGTEILIDRPALAAVGVSENTPTKLRSENLPQGIVLKQLLEPLGLAWRVVDATTLQVTSKEVVAGHFEVEFYLVRDQLAAERPEAIVERMKAAATAVSDGKSQGTIAFDPSSRCIIAIATQPAHAAIEAALARRAK